MEESRKNSVEKQGQRFTVSSKNAINKCGSRSGRATNDVLDLSPTYQNDSRAFSPSDSLEQFRC
jgi:hypothetical protein